MHTCPICSSKKSDEYIVTHDYRLATTRKPIPLRKCKNSECMHIWSSNIPSDEEIKSFYKEEFYKHSKKKTDIITRLNRTKLLKCINRNGEKKILDVGAGDGGLVAFLKDNNFNAYGVEPSKSGRRFAKEVHGLELISKNIFDIHQGNYDVINLSHVLEHVTDPISMLTKIHNLLGANGFLSIEIPNIQSWESAIFKSIYIHIDAPRHIHHFNENSFHIALSKAGFSTTSECGQLSMIQFPLSGIRSMDNYLRFNAKNSWVYRFLLRAISVPYMALHILINTFSRNKICLGGLFSKG